ncbi:hypothetical protein ACLBOM_37445 [Escherichia coli]
MFMAGSGITPQLVIAGHDSQRRICHLPGQISVDDDGARQGDAQPAVTGQQTPGEGDIKPGLLVLCNGGRIRCLPSVKATREFFFS